MSGFGGFGSSGFGSNNQSNTGFGGFGSTNQTNQPNQTSTGFGSTTGGFGSGNTASTGLFGNTSNAGGFGSAFGSNSSTSPFGQNKTGFGSTATTGGGGIFGGGSSSGGGGSTTTSGNAFGSGGFGGNTGGFGSSNTSSFGSANKPAGFGGVFGGGSSISPGFGATSNTGSSFTASTATPFGNNQQNTGSANTPFAAHTDKESNSAGSATNSYQTISAMPTYQKFSTEELRLVDYAQGRKHGNQSGQAGAFGATTGFGGFGGTSSTTSGFGTNTANPTTNTASTGLFGGGTSTSSPFGGGTSNATTAGFGSNTGGLFGQKPAGTSLFGSGTTTSAPSGGGLFGTSSGTGFGSTGNTGFGNTNTTTNAFGQTQNKGFGFGNNTTANTNTGTATGTGFGAGFGNTPSATNAFGNTSNTSAFGGNQQTNAFGFGQQNNQQQAGGGLFGGGGGGGFGANQQQQKPSLFGSTNTTSGAGLFGQQQPAQQQATGTSLFGNTGNQASGGLFGSKPAPTSLFGSANNNTAGGGGLFGAAQQPQQGGGLFGQPNTQQGGGLFGSRPAATGTGLGSGLFGASTNQQQQAGNSLFGSSQQQPAAGNSLFGSQQQNHQNQATHLVASLTENPYGNVQLFAGLQTPNQSMGPIATPLSTSQKSKKQAVIPQYRMAPHASSRLITPQKRTGGFGFSYSTYGTPGSAVSNASPLGLGNSLLNGGSLGRSLGKSLSTSNLRNSFTAQESLLAPGVFSSSPRTGAGSMKRLNINRNINTRHSLFSSEIMRPTTDSGSGSLLKKVSFENGIAPRNTITSAPSDHTESQMSGALVRTESPTQDSPPTSGSGAANGLPKAPEMEQVNGSKGKELAVVPENGSPMLSTKPAMTENEKARLTQKDQTPGEYFMKPSPTELDKLSPQQRAAVKELTVGRYGCGQIVFHNPQLANIPTNQICGHIVVFEIRSATVYGEKSPIAKPPQGKGLNVSSTITLENSWPRAKGGRLPVHERRGIRFDKHVERLKRVPDTEFVGYDESSGQWSFNVQHYTTYALDYDEDDSLMTTGLSLASGTPVADRPTPRGGSSRVLSVAQSHRSTHSSPGSSLDDTFDFKRGRQKIIPGQFDDEYEDFVENNMADNSLQSLNDGGRPVAESVEESSDFDGMEEMSAGGDEFRDEDDYEMAGSFPGLPTGAESMGGDFPASVSGPVKPKSILRVDNALEGFGTPSKFQTRPILGADWTEQLQRTASPKKQDRRALRENQSAMAKPSNLETTKKTEAHGIGFGTSIDIMKSLFASPGNKDDNKIPEMPSSKRLRSGNTNEPLDPKDMPYRNLTKSSWGPDSILTYATPGNAPVLEDDLMVNCKSPLVGEHTDVRFATFALSPPIIPQAIHEQRKCTMISVENQIPWAKTKHQINFLNFAQSTTIDTDAGVHEQQVWQLTSILFDDVRESLPSGLSPENLASCKSRFRKEKFSEFWKKLVQPEVDAQIYNAKSSEEKALIYLSGGNVPEACAALLSGMNHHLATLVAQIGGDEVFRRTMATQLHDWLELNATSEMNDYIRAIYEFLSGVTSECVGKFGPGAENIVSSFKFSERFKFDWKRAFGLRLWYGIYEDDDLAEAVMKFSKDLNDGNESSTPVPWFVEYPEDSQWVDPEAQFREDTLWGLLKLYADRNLGNIGSLATLQASFAPENTSGNPMDTRFSFQLITLLSAAGVGVSGNPNPSEKENEPIEVEVEDSKIKPAIDTLAATYAATLEPHISSNPDALIVACWALLHISDPQSRTRLICSLLDQHAPLLEPDDEKNPITKVLIGTDTNGGFRLPARWLCASKALYAGAVLRDSVAQARWLIEAGDVRTAHAVFCHVIGPTAVIERDHDGLREVLGRLVSSDAARLVDWDVGAGLYFDFVELLDLEGVRGGGVAATEQKKRRGELVRRLGANLEAVAAEVARSAGTGMDVRERVALQLMAAHVVEVGEKEEALDKSRVLRLPLSENAYLSYSKELSYGYFRAILAK